MILSSVTAVSVYGQEADSLQASAPDSSAAVVVPSRWTKSWVFNLNGNQATYRDWSEGGVNSLAFSTFTIFRLRYAGKKFGNTTRLNLRFGQTRLEDSGLEKTEDMIRISNKTEYFLTTEQVSAFAEVAFRTQFAKGFDEETGDLISNFMSPGYITESLGLSFQPNENFSAQMGMALKQTFVNADTLDSLYGLGEDEDFRSEGGIDVVIEFQKEVFKNFTYTAEFNSFTNLLIPIRSTDVIMFNRFTGKINSFMSSMIEFSFMYDDDYSSLLQVKQVVTLGFNIQIL
ncbi:DUF3078 domain-containing protein [Balneola sp. MJW-20]|uniref:DUF3078 domain-containing protein n=1 Tax=Gracilimonas aurantiaca TaxID=3234185 RepID=UPI00346775E5